MDETGAPAGGAAGGLWQAGGVPPGLPDPRFDRAVALRRLAEERFDVLVVGGGITGAGVALDAAARGLRTALVERLDFASGTSSRSSKMVHGGLRYLQQRDFRLVYEALRERQRLLANAPHLVTPLPFLIPLFGRGGVVDTGVARAYSTALWLYDLSGGLRIGRRHRRLDAAEALRHLPTLQAERLVAAFLYYDAQADDARLTLAVARTAALDHGAVVANYAEVTGLLHRGGQVAGVRLRPMTPAGRSEPAAGVGAAGDIEVEAAVVVNATGVWADDVRSLDEGAHPRSIRPAKGVHLTVPRAKLPADTAAVVPVRGDRRSIFVVPWPDGDDVYLGTTDTAWDGPLDDPVCLPEDVDYVLDAINAVVTDPLSRHDVTGVWAGLRPLLAQPDGHHRRERTADLSRRHTVRVSEHGLVTVTGGKLTTYRLMAQDAVDAAVAQLRRLGAAVPERAQRSRTASLTLRGAAGAADLLRSPGQRPAGIDEATWVALIGRHGGETPQLLDRAGGQPELLQPLVPGLPTLRVEALWAVEHEMALCLDDVLSRRTRSLLRRAHDTAEAAPAVAQLLAPRWHQTSEAAAAEADVLADQAHATLARAGLAPPVPRQTR